MEAWPQPSLTSSPSLPTNSSLSSLTSSSPPPPPPTVNPSVVDLVDELWFFRSVLPFPFLTFPCLPSPFSSYSPDSSTLLAQLMCSNPNHFTSVALSPSPRLPLSSSSSSSLSPPSQQQEEQPPLQNQQLQFAPRPFSSHYAYPPPSNGEDEESTEEEEENDDDEEEAEPADPLSLRDAEDALSGIYDVGVLLKDQHLKRRRGGLSSTLELQVMSRRKLREDRQESQNINTKVNSSKAKGLRELDTVEMTPHVLDVSEDDRYHGSVTLSYAPFHTEAWSILSALPNLRVSAPNEQVDMKEHLKLWAHAVALTLHRES